MRAQSVQRNSLYRNERPSSYIYGNSIQRHRPRLSQKYGIYPQNSNDQSFPNIVGIEDQNKSVDDDLRRVIRTEESPYDNELSYSPEKIVRVPSHWQELIVKQGEDTRVIIETEETQKKERASRYRETLDKMVKYDNKKKIDSRLEYVGPKHNQHQIDAIIRLERVQREQEKKQYSNDLKQLIYLKEDQKRREQERILKEQLHHQRTIDQVREYNQMMDLEKRQNKRKIFEEYKSLVDRKHQDSFIIKKLQEAQRGDQYFLKDDVRDQHYESIRNKVNNAEYFKSFQDKEYEKQRQIDDFVNKSIIEKQEYDKLEALKRQDTFKKAQIEAYANNQVQILEREAIARRQRDEAEERYRSHHDKDGLLQKLDHLETDQLTQQRKDYVDMLKHQIQSKKDSKFSQGYLTTAEQALNFRNKPQREFTTIGQPTSILFNGNSHERNLQLKYLDNWLKFDSENNTKA